MTLGAQRKFDSSVLMSVRPHYAELILAGEKTVEFRRKVPKRWQGPPEGCNDKLWLYATRPVSAVVGWVGVNSVMCASTERLWELCERRGKISARVFSDYFDGVDQGYAIWLWMPKAVKPITLEKLRKLRPGFNPPQAWRLDFNPYKRG